MVSLMTCFAFGSSKRTRTSRAGCAGSREEGGIMSTGKHYSIERTEDGKYTIRARGSQRPSDKRDTQAEAITRVKELNPEDQPELEWELDT